ncbi:MAG TPA: chemotaxis protein CheW [Thermoanaerobaculia bacterium]|nr:chemotaxis protein CheW [Thermoanaerobaculia bacterium]
MNGIPDSAVPPAAAAAPPGAPVPASAPLAGSSPAAHSAFPAPPTPPRLALFRLGGRLCGITAAFCKQFVQLDAVTPVPLAPAHLLGVTQLRGRILPVIDLTRLPGLPGLLGPTQQPVRPEPPELPELPEINPAGASRPSRPPDEGALAPAASGMPALVVTATGLDSAQAALRVTEIVGFERPATASGSPAAAAAHPLWRGEEVSVLDVASLLASLRPGPPHPPSAPRRAPAAGGGDPGQVPEPAA